MKGSQLSEKVGEGGQFTTDRPRATLEIQKIISLHRHQEIAHSDIPVTGQQLGGHYFTRWLVPRIYVLGGDEGDSTGCEDSKPE